MRCSRRRRHLPRSADQRLEDGHDTVGPPLEAVVTDDDSAQCLAKLGLFCARPLP
jgi:hypothetical protein